MKLNYEEEQWLENYQQILAQRFPGLVEQIVIFGSKAKETATVDSDLDILVVIREGNWRLKDLVTEPGYELALGTDVVPSIMVCTKEEWEEYRRDEAPFWQTVNRDGVVVA
ncbi:MAG TPA: nucleotidyltransferase domain-containing protein [Candidatus Binatia bacterium]|nr:nucleotidyltransferase domain-containing protein [Candidatus Binatia bacterium]